MPKRTWTDEQLIEAVACSFTVRQIALHLGLKNGRRESFAAHIERLGIDASHIRTLHGSLSRRPRSWSDDDLARVVSSSTSYSEVMRELGYEPSGGIHRWIKGCIRASGLSTEHFTGQAWARGRTLKPSYQRPLEEVLVLGSNIGSASLRRRLIKAGLKQERCEGCGLVEWQGESVPLMLDHINGDPLDNRLENLRILCPNCHAQTPTWCAGNRKLKRTPA